MSEATPATERVVVIGAGTMGHGIAQVAAMGGYEAVLTDRDEQALAQALDRVRANLDKGVDKGKVEPTTRDRALERLRTVADWHGEVGGATLVIEAIPEDMEAKRSLLAELDRHCDPSTVLGTNTSSLSITGLAAATDHPERVVGTHFFNPPHILTLMEIVRGDRTADTTVERVWAHGERMERAMLVVRDTPGFATSRLGLVLGLEAIRMVEQGVATVEGIDRAMELGYRHPMGPLKLTDLIGLDTRLDIAEHLHHELGGEPFHPPPLLRRMVRAGKLGRKAGEGFYRW